MTTVTEVLAPQAAPTIAPAHPIRLLVRHPLGVVGLAMLGAALLVAVGAPLLAPYDPYASVRVTIADIYQAPGSLHLLGTDDRGKDVLSSLLFGTRVSLVVGFTAALITIVIGAGIGLLAGYFARRLGAALMRITDFFLVIPELALLIVIVAIVGQSLVNIIVVIGLLGWPTTARLVRSQTLSVRERKYVMRARAVGAGDLHIIRHHVLPPVLPLTLANTILVVSLAILAESTLAFIGLGDPTVISWGQMLNFAFNRGAASAGAWWALIPPGLAIVWVVLGTTLVGTALEDVFNVGGRRHHLERSTGSLEGSPAAAAAQPRHPRGEPASEEPILRVTGLTVEFGTPEAPLRAVDGVGFSLRRGETLGLVGESGCGKTTTVLGLLRLLPPGARIVDGSVIFEGQDLLRLSEAELRGLRWKRLAIVFQGAMNALNPVRTVADQVAEAIQLHEPGIGRRGAARQAVEMLERVGIGAGRADEHPHAYSGGMRQRAMIALALACRPDVIVADEPTTALDVMIQAQILELLSSLGREFGMATILVTHDLGVVAETCDRVVVMYGGRVAEDAETHRLFAHPQHPYTRLLLDSFPDVDAPRRPLAGIPGSPPRLDAMPPGCAFAPRCPHAFDRCRREAPPLYEVGDARRAACFLVEPPR